MSDARIIEAGFIRGKKRTTTLKVGSVYRVVPLNPKKMKHRDRICTLTAFEDDFFTEKVSVRFHDDDRVTQIEAAHLAEEDTGSSSQSTESNT